MSADNPSQLSFACPNCQKKLRASTKLAGQKLACPQCKNPVKVPGIVPQQNDEDDWLKLDSEQDSVTDDDANAFGNAMPLHDRAMPPQDRTVSEPAEDKKEETKSAGPIASPQGIGSGRPSLFDDDLPELAPLVDSAIREQSKANAIASANSPASQPLKSNSAKPKSAAAPRSSTDPSTTSSASNKSPGSRAESNPPTRQAATPQPPLPSLDDLDDDFKLSPVDNSSKPSSGAAGDFPEFANMPSLDDFALQAKALDIGSSLDAVEEEFGFPCKVCGTRLYSPRSRAGKQIRCPDCYSEVSIPTPPKKKAKYIENRTELAEVSFKPIDSKSLKDQVPSRSQTDQLLERAKTEIDAEQKELDGITTSFDGIRWFSLIFWFCRDPLLAFIMILFGIFCAAWIWLVSAIPQLLAGGNDRLIAVVQAISFLLPCVPVFGSVFALGMAVLSTVANQYRRIQDWPFARPSETAAEVITVLAAAAIASVPGGMIGSGIASATGFPAVTAFFGLLTLWILFPFLLLSMADNNAITEPFSRNVFDSMKAKPDSWGAMYLQTMFAMGMLFVLIVWSLRDGPAGEIVFGLCMPFLVLFIFNQYGLLAGRISDVTGLGFSGDFSQDEVDE